jgi:ribosomal protein L14E/L6E/L27E
MKDVTNKFDAVTVLAEVKEARSVRRKRTTWGKSKLTKHLAELVKLKDAGASLRDLQHWLRNHKRIKIDASNISRFLKKIMAKKAWEASDGSL